jgi:hypothetical protein
MELQLSKAERVVRMWGIPERRLRAWLDAGVVAAKPVGRGRGSMRLMTDASLADAFLAARLLHDLPMGRVQSCLAAARPRYGELFTVRAHAPYRIVFQWKHTDHEVQIAVAMGPFFRTLKALRRAPGIAKIHRGRKPKRWQDEFAQLAAGIGTDLRAVESRLPPIRETIRAYRTSRRGAVHELRVTVPA